MYWASGFPVLTKRVTVTAPFRAMSQRVPGVLPFVGLRLASWALQWPAIGERVKALMVRALMTSGSEVSARTERTVTVGTDVVDVRDTLDGDVGFWRGLTRVSCGLPFNAIHMASAGYVVPTSRTLTPVPADLATLSAAGRSSTLLRINVDGTSATVGP